MLVEYVVLELFFKVTLHTFHGLMNNSQRYQEFENFEHGN